MVLISRAHLVDFDAVVDAVKSGKIRCAVDVFPEEPVAPDSPLRTLAGMILSPHRAAAVSGGRHLIGRMILDDLAALAEGRPERRLLIADARYAEKQAGIGDAKSVAQMADKRQHGS